MTDTNVVYGVIGGLGAYAGLDVVRRLNDMVAMKALETRIQESITHSAAIVDSDFPEVMYYQLPFSGVSASGGITDSDSVIRLEEAVSKAQKYFEYASVDKALFACNTYNKALSEGDAESENVSLNEMFDNVVNNTEGKVLVLASAEKTRQIKERTSDAERFVFLAEEDQKRLDQCISTTIFRGQDYTTGTVLHRLIKDVLGDYYQGADNILIACTELSMYYNTLKYDFEHEQLLASFKYPEVYDTVEEALKTMVSVDDNEGSGDDK